MIIPKEQIMWEVFCKFKQGYKLLDYKKRWQQPNGENMTDKKEIIIDGVDVSKCYRFSRKTGYCEGAFKPEELPFCENFDCYFKQRKRKEQECEELIKEKAEIKKYLGISDKTIIQRLEELQEFKDKLKISEYNYKQALDEIEEFCVIYSDNHDTYETVYKHILNIIDKVKDGE